MSRLKLAIEQHRALTTPDVLDCFSAELASSESYPRGLASSSRDGEPPFCRVSLAANQRF
jgi:hypothetical protein